MNPDNAQWWSLVTQMASQVAQWQRTCLAMQETQETWVRSTPVFLAGKFHGQRSQTTVHGVAKSQDTTGHAHMQQHKKRDKGMFIPPDKRTHHYL